MLSGLAEQSHKMWLSLSRIPFSSPGTAPLNHRILEPCNNPGWKGCLKIISSNLSWEREPGGDYVAIQLCRENFQWWGLYQVLGKLAPVNGGSHCKKISFIYWDETAMKVDYCNRKRSESSSKWCLRWKHGTEAGVSFRETKRKTWKWMKHIFL